MNRYPILNSLYFPKYLDFLINENILKIGKFSIETKTIRNKNQREYKIEIFYSLLPTF